MVGASSGIVAPPRVPFDTQVSPLAPCSAKRPVEVDRHADDGEPAKADHRPVRNIADRVGECGEDLRFGHFRFPADYILLVVGLWFATPPFFSQL